MNNVLSEQQFLRNLYEAFNRREFEKIFSMMQPDVIWANGMEGGFVYGRDAVREYWRKQFEVTQSRLEPLEFELDENNRSVVTVHLVVRDLEGNLLAEKTVRQIFTIENDLISLFEIGDDAEPLGLMKTSDK
jgi:nuclear transport factor 2 (NTF2) superfamily protein